MVAILAVMLALGADFEVAMRVANAGAAVVVGKPGTAAVSIDELRHRILPASALAAEDKVVYDRARARAAPRRMAPGRSCASASPMAASICCIAGMSVLMAEARSACDRLVVGLNSDASVTRLKGAGRPIQDVASRADVLAALEAVDLVVVFEEDTPLELIRRTRPARSTASSAASTSARDATFWIGRPAPLSRVTDASLLRPTTRRSQAPRAAAIRTTCPDAADRNSHW